MNEDSGIKETDYSGVTSSGVLTTRKDPAKESSKQPNKEGSHSQRKSCTVSKRLAVSEVSPCWSIGTPRAWVGRGGGRPESNVRLQKGVKRENEPKRQGPLRVHEKREAIADNGRQKLCVSSHRVFLLLVGGVAGPRNEKIPNSMGR